MGKYRLSNGLMVFPDKDIKMLEAMSRKGYHVDSINAFGLYHFSEGEPKDYIYAINYEQNLREDFLDYYQASGWTPIIVQDGIQIFRGVPGSIPIFTDKDSKLEMLCRYRNGYLKATIVTFLLLLLYTLSTRMINLGVWEVVIWACLWCVFVFPATCLYGLVRAVRQLQKG